MKSANKEFLNTFFSNNLQYVVPFFQRSYVWGDTYWETLWEHIEQLVDSLIAQKGDEHFLGTLITKQRESQPLGENKYDLIDGQQRLTTFSLLIKAIANSASGNMPYAKLKNKTNELVVFENSKGQPFIRLEHSKIDKEYFEAVMLDKDLSKLKNQEHGILSCYNYFKKKLSNYTDEQLDNLKTVILNNFPVISMILSPNDDEQEIFDTINSLGVRLTHGELLKNFIFKDQPLQDYYETHWFEVFEEDEDKIEFWNRKKTSGRIVRTNIAVLLYSYLIIKTKSEIRIEKLFIEYKNWLKTKTNQEKIDFLNELKEYASIYSNFPQGIMLNEFAFGEYEKRFFHVIKNLEITTVYPLVLYIYKNLPLKSDIEYNLNVLESYLIRRNICSYTTKNYNKGFIQIIRGLEDLPPVDKTSLYKILIAFAEDTNLFPNDVEFADAFSAQAINNINAREILYCIALKQIYSGFNDRDKLSSGSFSVEHILPQKWETNWSVPGMDDLAKLNRNKKLKTLGNLTLVTGALNSKMRNGSWIDKKKVLTQFSSLKITTDYLGLNDWDETSIHTRGQNLSKTALDVWKR